MSRPKFKVGDVVEVIKSGSSFKHFYDEGCVGIIKKIDYLNDPEGVSEYVYEVIREEGSYYSQNVSERDLEIASYMYSNEIPYE